MEATAGLQPAGPLPAALEGLVVAELRALVGAPVSDDGDAHVEELRVQALLPDEREAPLPLPRRGADAWSGG